MYSDIHTIKGMIGQRGVLNESGKFVERKRVKTFFGAVSEIENLRDAKFKLNYSLDIPKFEGWKISQKRKSTLAISTIDSDFIDLKGGKYSQIRNSVNKYQKVVTSHFITDSDISDLINFIDEWKTKYGFAKYGMQLHIGYDVRFLKEFYNENDYYGLFFKINGKIVGYSVISKHLDNENLNYIIGKSDTDYKGLAQYLDYFSFRNIYKKIGDHKICWGASQGGLLDYKRRFNVEMLDCYFLTYEKENTTSKSQHLKELLGIMPVNVWDCTKQNWSLKKSKWNELIDTAGLISGVENPRFATREDCWQGMGKFAEVVTGKKINGGASVLDPFACELLLKLFMPKEGGKVYNPFGGGVQMGFVAGFLGFEYLATEIRQNQCDANNQICNAFQMESVKWECADSSTYEPKENIDFVFSCPPYYKVETYKDYEGVIPHQELNSQKDYETFRELLFNGYKKAIDKLNDNRFVAIMLGDSRDPKGAYYSFEAETELFLKSLGLHIYNRIVFLEHQITRGMLATNSIQSRKLPKVEQKIIIAYKGNLNNIRSLYDEVRY